MYTNAPIEMPEWNEETQTEFEKFAEPAGILEMPPTPDDWLEEKDDWQAGEGTDPADWPDSVEITLSLEDLEMLVRPRPCDLAVALAGHPLSSNWTQPHPCRRVFSSREVG